MHELATTDNRQQLISAVVDGLESPHTQRAYNRHLTAFLAWHSSQGKPALTKATVNAYKAHLVGQGSGASVVNQALAAIRKMITEAADNGQVDQATAQAIAKVQNVKAETLPAGRSIAGGELTALLATCGASKADIRDAAIISLLYSCGLRRGELVALALEHYNSETGELRILHAKGNKSRLAFVEGGAAAALGDWLTIRGDWPGPLFCPVYRSGRLKRAGMTTQAIYHLLHKRAQLAGLAAPVSPHDFRRTFIGDLLDAGADIATVQKMAGHSKVDTTARYDRRPDAAKRRAARLLHVPYSSRL